MGWASGAVFLELGVLRIEDLGVCCWVGYREFSYLVLGWVSDMEVLVSGQGRI